MTAGADAGFSVLVLDNSRTGEPDGERLAAGFATIEAATGYAVARVRDSLEELRGSGMDAAALRTLWHLYGEDCVVLGHAVRGSDLLDLFIATPATADERGRAGLAPRLRRFRAVLPVSDAARNSVWCGGFFRAVFRQPPQALLERFRSETPDAFARQGIASAEPLDVHVASHPALPDPPRPPAGDGRALHAWRVGLTFVCHDVRFGADAGGVFLWPEQPAGRALDAMARVLAADMPAVRGDDPANADLCDLPEVKVVPSEAPPDYPPD